MPDLQTALSKVLDEWAKDDQPAAQSQPQPQEKPTMQNPPLNITNNVSRATFYFVRANPGLTKAEICTRLVAEGYKFSSVTSLVSQLRRTSQIELRGDKYYALMNDYAPINQVAIRAMRKHKQQKKDTKKPATPEPKSAGIAALQPVAAPAPAPVLVPASAPMVISNDVEYILSTLPIKQARSLYDELHKIFGVKA